MSNLDETAAMACLCSWCLQRQLGEPEGWDDSAAGHQRFLPSRCCLTGGTSAALPAGTPAGTCPLPTAAWASSQSPERLPGSEQGTRTGLSMTGSRLQSRLLYSVGHHGHKGLPRLQGRGHGPTTPLGGSETSPVWFIATTRDVGHTR